MAELNISVQGSNRCLFIGKTGTGKTTLSRYLMSRCTERGWNVVIFDPKKEWMEFKDEEGKSLYRDTEENKEKSTVETPYLSTDKFEENCRVQLFQSHVWRNEYEQVCQDIMDYGNTIVYFDEITQYANANSIPNMIRVLLTQGRSRNVGVWTSTQRPVRIPEDTKSQSEKIFIFRVNSARDKKSLEGYIPDSSEFFNGNTPYHFFWYYSDDMESPVLMKPININGVNNAKT